MKLKSHLNQFKWILPEAQPAQQNSSYITQHSFLLASA